MKKIDFGKCKKWIIAVLVLIVTNFISYFIGSHYFYMAADVYPHGESMRYPHWYNTLEALQYERKLSNALFEGLHRFYGDPGNNFWYSSFCGTKEYQKLDSLLNQNWGDFYYYDTPILEDWYAVYGQCNEPSQEEKEKILKGLPTTSLEEPYGSLQTK